MSVSISIYGCRRFCLRKCLDTKKLCLSCITEVVYMRIIVPIKQVPDTKCLQVDEQTGTVMGGRISGEHGIGCKRRVFTSSG